MRLSFQLQNKKTKNISEQQSKYRLTLYNAIKTGKLKIKECDLEKLVRIKDILPKDSASASIQMFGGLKYKTKDPNISIADNDIFIKLSFKSAKPELNNSLDVEKNIYKMTNRLIEANVTPNIMVYVSSFQCENFFDQQTITPNVKIIKERAIQIYQNDEYDIYDTSVANILILERGRGEKLQNFSNLSLSEWKSVLFQLIYTLQALHENGIYHNDLHTGNIWIQDIDLKTLTYNVGNKYYIIDTKLLIKIYDFDLSFSGKQKNTKLDMENEDGITFCEAFGVCNFPNKKFDIFTALWYIYNYQTNIPKEVKEFIDRNIDPAFQKTIFGFPGRICKYDIYNSLCEPYIPTDKEVKPLSEMLKDPFFHSLIQDFALSQPVYKIKKLF